MRPDIANRNDIERLLKRFYEKAFADPTIGYFFTEVAKLDLATHLPVIADFWETVLLNTGSYRGNTLEVHKQLHGKSPLSEAHFNRWLALFNETIDEMFEGPVAGLAKTRALSIATVIRVKLSAS